MGGCCVQKMKIMGQMNEEVEEDPEDLVLSMRFYSSIGLGSPGWQVLYASNDYKKKKKKQPL